MNEVIPISEVQTDAAHFLIEDQTILEKIQERVLWLATRMVDYANRERINLDGLKVGGHQASSASMVSIMTALYCNFINAEDRVSVKPHASPVFHAIQFLLGNLDKKYLTQLRKSGGLQSYPSRTKDPDVVDFSTGSVGLGAVAPLFAATTRRYIDCHFGPRPNSRFIAVIGDAELDEGNIWEALADPVNEGLGNVMWVVDFNRQSLDRVIPGVRIAQWRAQFEAAGWHVRELKYGVKLEQVFAQAGSEAFKKWFDDIPNEQYQSLFGLRPKDARTRFLDGASNSVADFLTKFGDDELFEILTDLGGHNLTSLVEAFSECDRVNDRPSVVFAYTIKGWKLPIAGDPRNHSAQISATQIDELRARVGLTVETEWNNFEPGSPEDALLRARNIALNRVYSPNLLEVDIPITTGVANASKTSTQEVFGRALTELSRDENIRRYLVTVAPDVATSTNLGGFINRTGVFHPTDRRRWNEDPVLKWAEGPSGQHIELGISEMNLFSLLGQLGLSGDLHNQPLIPIGTVYDPFVLRGLDAFIYSVYSGAKFILSGTPSGITLAPEGGAHQSTITPSVGIELPGVVLLEPAYGQALDWLFCDAVAHVSGSKSDTTPDLRPNELAFYFRLTTRAIDQTPFIAARERLGEATLRSQVLAGAYRLIDGRLALSKSGEHNSPVVHLVGCGAVMPEVLVAAEELASEGVIAHVVDVTSPGRLFGSWQRTLKQGIRTASTPSFPGVLRPIFSERAPIVSIHDGSSHALAWLGSALGSPQVAMGVDSFGQSGNIQDLYRIHDLDSGSIVNGALAAISLNS
ncbi:MAG: 1-deoxy-D-xylulose-5-phosphate synthase N-terminal domain-containing protein [Candidatus Nanopelagicales bacterium]|jgi:pyruvate dehydrogenase E1 component